MKTKAWVLRDFHTLQLQELEIPALRSGQVLVEMHYTGLCRSQLNEITGAKGSDPYLPHTLGHEGAGKVVEVGPGVTKVTPGDCVVVSWIKGSGAEAGGTVYTSASGAVNSGPISTFQQHAVISENRLFRLPEQMPLKEAALLGCALPTGAGVVFHQMQLQPGQSLAVVGIGGVGSSALIAAKSVGADPLIAIDAHPDKLEHARKMGATHVFSFEEPIPHSVDFALECAGQKAAMEKAFSLIRPGGLCVIAGNLPKGETISIDPFDLIRGKRIQGSWGGGAKMDSDVERYVTLFLNRQLHLSPLITHDGTLEQIPELFRLLQEGKVGRAVVRMV